MYLFQVLVNANGAFERDTVNSTPPPVANGTSNGTLNGSFDGSLNGSLNGSVKGSLNAISNGSAKKKDVQLIQED